jgi:MurNAc alpha-1-phosphate uridylyltransferase
MSAVPATAMVLAAGLGTRMRPLTDDRPKALVEVGGKALIDHMLDRLAEAGTQRAVVNVHAFADALIAHLRRRRSGPEIVVSDERAHPTPLETGGGIRFARALLPQAPILVANIDSVWIEDGEPPAAAIHTLCKGFDPATMAARLLLARMECTSGFDGAGDFALEADGRLQPRRVTGAATAPFNYMGVHIVDPRPICADPRDAFGLFPLQGPFWADWAAAGRLHGLVMEGAWMHVGDPAARDEAEARLAKIKG